MAGTTNRQCAATSAARTWPGSDATLWMTKYNNAALIAKGTANRSVRFIESTFPGRDPRGNADTVDADTPCEYRPQWGPLRDRWLTQDQAFAEASGDWFGQRRAEIPWRQLLVGEESQAQAGDEDVLDRVRDDDQRQRRLRIGADRAKGGCPKELLGADIARTRWNHDPQV